MENKREELKKFLDKLKFVLSSTCEIERKKQLRLYFLIEIISDIAMCFEKEFHREGINI